MTPDEIDRLYQAVMLAAPMAAIAKEPFAHRDLRRARAAADKIRATLTEPT